MSAIAYLFVLTIYLEAKKNFWSDVGEDPRSDPALATEIDRTLSLLPTGVLARCSLACAGGDARATFFCGAPLV